MPAREGVGAVYLGGQRCRFRVWAPYRPEVALRLVAPQERVVPLKSQPDGYHEAVVEGVSPGADYFYQLAPGLERPDPASRFQPNGVHGPSRVTEPDFPWGDAGWRGLPLTQYLLYELHVGTFSPEGTFEGVLRQLPRLSALGVTAVELMPVAPFPGNRNWGYDGVYPYAVQASYGGPEGLKKLVAACHKEGLAVVLDVVYNHFGPEGNYVGEFGPYFTDRYRTPWGRALNFDGPESRPVRDFFIGNALAWVRDFHIDALRLDALHAIFDASPRPFLSELSEAVREAADALGRKVHLIAETDLNDTRLIRPGREGGFGLDAQWNDDFHHALHTLLTAEADGYYQDFGRLGDLAQAFRQGYVLSGRYSAYRKRPHGQSSAEIPADRFVVFSQNHDQVGNRARGERLGALTDWAGQKLAAGAVLLSPFIPLLFMGEEYGEEAPFQYFVSHTDPLLIEAVRAGRVQEFERFAWGEGIPDPQEESTFLRCKLRPGQINNRQRLLLEFYQTLIRLRRQIPALSDLSKERMEVVEEEANQALWLRRFSGQSEVLILLYFGTTRQRLTLPFPGGSWQKRLDSSETRWQGPGSQIPERIPPGHCPPLELSSRAVLLLERSPA